MDELREELSKQIAIEARFLLVTDTFLEDIGMDASLPEGYTTSGDVGELVVGPANSEEVLAALEHKPLEERELPPLGTQQQKFQTLDDLQTEFLLRATQAHAGAKQLQFLKALVLNGESARIQLFTKPQDIEFTGMFIDDPLNRDAQIQYLDIDGEEKAVTPGITFEIKPVITADQQYVIIKGHVLFSEVLENQTIEFDGKNYEIPLMQVANIPIHAVVKDKEPLLIIGPEISRTGEQMIQKGRPVLDRWLENRAKVTDKQRLLILIKPTIIIPDEVEADAIGALAPRRGEK